MRFTLFSRTVESRINPSVYPLQVATISVCGTTIVNVFFECPERVVITDPHRAMNDCKQYIPEVPPGTPNVLFGTLSRPSLIDNISIG